MASITITVADADVPRIAAAIGDKIGLRGPDGLPRAATAAEMRAWVVDNVKRVTFAYEDQLSEANRARPTEVTAS